MLIKTTKYALGELAEKCRIVADEQDLLDDYSLTEEEATDAAHSLDRMEREGDTVDTEKFSDKVLKMLAGECEDAAIVQRDIAKTAHPDEADAIHRGKRELQKLADALKFAIWILR